MGRGRDRHDAQRPRAAFRAEIQLDAVGPLSPEHAPSTRLRRRSERAAPRAGPSRTAIVTLLRNTKRCSAAASVTGSASGSSSQRFSSSNFSSANSAITRPLGVSQPLHCQWPGASALDVVHELRLRERSRIAAGERDQTVVGQGENQARRGLRVVMHGGGN